MKGYFNAVIRFILVFLYCANIGFFFLPGKIKTTLVIGVIGFFYYVFKFQGKDTYNIKKIVLAILPLALWMGLSIIVNNSDQPWFLQYVILQILFAFGAVFIIDYTQITSIDQIAWCVVIYTLLQNIVAFLGLQLPIISEIIHLVETNSFLEHHEQMAFWRGIGLGEHAFFTGGIWSAIGLLFLTYLYMEKRIKTIFFVVFYLLIFTTGLFVARTTITGLVGLIMLIMPLRKNLLAIFKYAILGIIFVFFFENIMALLKGSNDGVGYAFQLFDNIAGGNIETSSSNRTIEMWKTLPTNMSTWIVGDAQYEDAINGGYYKHIDVGFLRIIFYGGIIGLIFYLGYIFYLCRRIYLLNSRLYDVKKVLTIFYLMVLLWMWKGHSDTNIMLYLLLFIPICKHRAITLKFHKPD